jgi:tetratricopeptide (TPR) repeat protein
VPPFDGGAVKPTEVDRCSGKRAALLMRSPRDARATSTSRIRLRLSSGKVERTRLPNGKRGFGVLQKDAHEQRGLVATSSPTATGFDTARVSTTSVSVSVKRHWCSQNRRNETPKMQCEPGPTVGVETALSERHSAAAMQPWQPRSFRALLSAFPLWWSISTVAAGDALAGDPASAAEASPPAASNSERAKQLFGSGFRLAQQGDYEAAAAAFEQAYEASPNAFVLFNLGLAYAAAGDPVRAHDAFEKYLADTPKEGVDPQREELVKQALSVAEGRIGKLHIEVSAPGASIEVDARSIGVAPLSQPVRVKAGSHAIVARHANFQLKVVNVVVQPRSEERIALDLEPAPRLVPPGYLMVRCGTPDLELYIAGKPVGKTPFTAPIAISPGRYDVLLSREGYLPEPSAVELATGEARWLLCRAEPKKAHAPDHAQLRLNEQLRRAGAQLYIDGRLELAPVISVPNGKHDVEVRRPHFQSWAAQLQLEATTSRELSPRLVPTEEHRAESIAKRERQLFWSGIALGTGVVLGSTAVALGMHTENKHDRWQAERDALNGDLVATEEVAARLRANYDEALVIQRLEYATAAAGALGLASLGLSALLWFTAEKVPGNPAPQIVATPFGASIVYQGNL